MKRSFLSLMLLAAATTAAAQTAVLERPKRDVTISPPVADRAAIRLLKTATKEGNAVLLVDFGPSERTPKTLTIQVDRERKATLRDDGQPPDERAGDGIHSAWITVSLDDLKRVQESTRRAKEIPLFVGREIIGTAVVSGTDKELSLRDLPVVPNRANTMKRDFREKINLRLPIADLVAGRIIPIFPFPNPASIDPVRSLMVNDPGVVNDPTRTFNPCTNVGTPMGVWTFGHLMAEMANGAGIPPSAFVRKWLRKWEVDQTVNDFVVTHRSPIANVINQWPKLPSGELNLAKAPFKLVAIVNRIDLGENLTYGGGGAGEGRFVFALTDGNCNPERFLVIFEYKIHRSGCFSVKGWAQQWKNLDSFAVGTPAYNTALAAITVQFTEAGTNPTQLPNHSSLSQLRTNEIALGSPWELREFRLSPINGQLFEDTVKQTPDFSFNHTADLAAYANSDSVLILQDKHNLPEDLNMGLTPFRGGAAPVPTPSFHWDGPTPEPSASMSGTPNLRFHLSFNTCNACHGGETNTTFTHVSQTGALSGFLTGITVTDPAGEGVTRTFNDLLRRQQRMAQILVQPCFFDIFFDPIRMVH